MPAEVRTTFTLTTDALPDRTIVSAVDSNGVFYGSAQDYQGGRLATVDAREILRAAAIMRKPAPLYQPSHALVSTIDRPNPIVVVTTAKDAADPLALHLDRMLAIMQGDQRGDFTRTTGVRVEWALTRANKVDREYHYPVSAAEIAEYHMDARIEFVEAEHDAEWFANNVAMAIANSFESEADRAVRLKREYNAAKAKRSRDKKREERIGMTQVGIALSPEKRDTGRKGKK